MSLTMQGPVSLLADPVISKGQLQVVSPQVEATQGAQALLLTRMYLARGRATKCHGEAEWRAAADGAGVGGVTLTSPSRERCGRSAAPQCPVPSHPWDCWRLTQAQTPPRHHVSCHTSGSVQVSHPTFDPTLELGSGAPAAPRLPLRSLFQPLLPSPQPTGLQCIQGEDAASSPAPAAQRVGGSGEGSGPSWVYTKLSGCCADAAQARTNHPNQLHQHWEHNSQQMGNWV